MLLITNSTTTKVLSNQATETRQGADRFQPEKEVSKSRPKPVY